MSSFMKALRPPYSTRAKATACGVLVILLGAGATVTTISVSQYNAETERLCSTAMHVYEKSVIEELADRVELGTTALNDAADETIQKDIPGAGEYSSRVAVKADAEKKLAARPASKALIENVRTSVAAAESIGENADCTTRDEATAIRAETKIDVELLDDLTDAAHALSVDVDAYRRSETARIEAEKKAAAEQAAAEQAAQNYYAPAVPESGYSGGGGYVVPAEPISPPSSGGGYAPPSQGGDGVCVGNCYL